MYIKIILNTSTGIVYAGSNRRSLNATVQFYVRYSTLWLAIKIRYNDSLYWFVILTRYTNCPREHVRLFVSTGGIIESSNVTPVDDYK